MTPKEKAEELHRKFWTGRDPIAENLRLTTSWSSATQCALIAVDEIIEVAYWQSVKDYYKVVKQEIEKL